jgi:pimeloyl-ACP methyl ester carboxylesterase
MKLFNRREEMTMNNKRQQHMEKHAFIRNRLRGIVFYVLLIVCLAGMLMIVPAAIAQADWPGMIPSKDGTPISYEVYGRGEPTLVFIHGWSCDSRYFRMQIPRFSKEHRMVLVDLAGHGHSGMDRSRYTMESFGEDVKAVVEATGSEKVILIGHSMGGNVIAEAARLMPERVLGLIGIDTLENVEYKMTTEDMNNMLSPFREDFRKSVRSFAGDMIIPSTDPVLREWIISDMAAAPPSVAVSAIEEMLKLYVTGEAATMFREIPLPVVTVNASLWLLNTEGNRKYMHSYEAIVLDGTDHFLMMNQPERFNAALEKALDMILE